jgi:hypothetical protein
VSLTSAIAHPNPNPLDFVFDPLSYTFVLVLDGNLVFGRSVPCGPQQQTSRMRDSIMSLVGKMTLAANGSSEGRLVRPTVDVTQFARKIPPKIKLFNKYFPRK